MFGTEDARDVRESRRTEARQPRDKCTENITENVLAHEKLVQLGGLGQWLAEKWCTCHCSSERFLSSLSSEARGTIQDRRTILPYIIANTFQSSHRNK
jgi:hypothetical protein